MNRLTMWHGLAAVLASAVLWGVVAQGGPAWALGFVAMLPWLHWLDAQDDLWRSLLGAWALSAAFSLSCFAWLGLALGRITGWGEVWGLLTLLVLAPLFQPQVLVYAWLRQWTRRRHGPVAAAVAGPAAWVAAEWLLPKLLDDSLGHGLYPSEGLRQAADLAGVPGLTLALLLSNEALNLAWAWRQTGWRQQARAWLAACLPPLLLAGYGVTVLHQTAPGPEGPALRIGLIQANISGYEALREQHGSYAAVREVLKTHFAMSYDAIEHHHADAVLWTETAYPTTLGQPKSPAGAALDRELLATVRAAGVPFVLGTYERDAMGEYNTAAFVQPDTGLLGHYRKTRLFPLTESVPGWLDGPLLRRWWPWLGTWRQGSGARVFPLRLADGREVPVLPLVCLDDVDSGLGLDGARQGARAILTLSNDAWFTANPQGARLHLAAAAFRSIETRLPQFRVTTNGISAIIDRHGQVVAAAGMEERSVVLAGLPTPAVTPTVLVRWGHWLEPLCLLGLLGLLMPKGLRSWLTWWGRTPQAVAIDAGTPLPVALLPPVARGLTAGLQVAAGLGLAWMAARWWLDEGWRVQLFSQFRWFVGLVLAPQAAAWCVVAAFRAHSRAEAGQWLLRGQGPAPQVHGVPLDDVLSVTLWRLPLPGPGVCIRLRSGLRISVVVDRPQALATQLARPLSASTGWWQRWGWARTEVPRGTLSAPLLRFGLWPLLLALPAFRLHQLIAYGGLFGEYHSFGLQAYLLSLSIWWASWAMGTVFMAAGLRTLIEVGALAAAAGPRALPWRLGLERAGLLLFYLAVPGLLLVWPLIQ